MREMKIAHVKIENVRFLKTYNVGVCALIT